MTTRTVEQVQADAFRLAEQIDELTHVENPSQGQLDKLDRYLKGAKRLAVELDEARDAERAENLAKIREAAKDPRNIENEESTRRNLDPNYHASGPQVIRKRFSDPWSFTRDGAAIPADVRDRAFAATEQATFTTDVDEDATRQRVTELLERNEQDIGFQAFVTAVSNPHYAAAFRRLVTDPVNGSATLREDERAALAVATNPWMLRAMSTTAADGGFLIPFHLDPTLIVTGAQSANPFRKIARVETITSDAWHGVSGSAEAEWIAEASEMTDASPQFSQPTIPVEKADATFVASFEVAQDAANFDQTLMTLINNARDNLEAEAFAVGTGSGQPTGVVTALATLTATSMVTSTTNGALGWRDAFKLDNAVPSRAYDNASWVGHRSVFNHLRQESPDAAGSAYWTDLGPGLGSTLLGHAVHASSSMFGLPLSAATASNDDVLILGRWDESFCIVDRAGTTLVTAPRIGSTRRVLTGEWIYAAWWRVGSNVIDAGTNLRFLRV